MSRAVHYSSRGGGCAVVLQVLTILPKLLPFVSDHFPVPLSQRTSAFKSRIIWRLVGQCRYPHLISSTWAAPFQWSGSTERFWTLPSCCLHCSRPS